jgi:hypothetical protein
MLENQDNTKTENKTKGKWGGPRPNSGRPKRMDEQAIIEKLTPMAETAFKVLNQKILDGDMNAIKLYMSYFLGMPTQKVESKIEGQLNQVSIEVVKPQMVKEEVLVN